MHELTITQKNLLTLKDVDLEKDVLSALDELNIAWLKEKAGQIKTSLINKGGLEKGETEKILGIKEESLIDRFWSMRKDRLPSLEEYAEAAKEYFKQHPEELE